MRKAKRLPNVQVDPTIYPHLSPARVVLADVVSLGKGISESSYREDPGNPRAGHGPARRCATCGTVLRAGQPHTALEPVPHQDYGMLIVQTSARYLEAAQ